MSRVLALWRDSVTLLRAMPAVQVLIRLLMVLTGMLAFALVPDRGVTLAGVLAWLALVAAPFAALRPGSDGPATVVAGLAASWAVGYGGHLPGVGRTVLFGALLYAHHVLATYAAGTPATAMPDRAVARRWSVPVLAGLLGLAVAAVAGFGTRQLPLSPVVQVAGLVGVLAAAGVLVMLARR